MARQTNRTIPSAFIELDATVTDPDACVNVRDIQVARENHNFMMARGLMRSVYSQSFVDGYTIAPRGGVTGDLTPRRLASFFQTFIPVSALAQKLRIVMSIASEDSDNNDTLTLHAFTNNAYDYRDVIGVTSQAITIQGDTETRYALDAPLPYFSGSYTNGARIIRLSMAVEPSLPRTIASAQAINAVANSGGRIEVADTLVPYPSNPITVSSIDYVTSIGKPVYFAGSGGTGELITPRTVAYEEAGTSGYRYLYFDKPPTPAPTTAHTFTMLAAAEPVLYSLDIYEIDITDFGADRGAL